MLVWLGCRVTGEICLSGGTLLGPCGAALCWLMWDRTPLMPAICKGGWCPVGTTTGSGSGPGQIVILIVEQY